MLIDCPAMSGYRNTCELYSFIATYRRLQPQISSLKLYSIYLNDSLCTNIKEKVLTLYHMKAGWMKKMGINYNI